MRYVSIDVETTGLDSENNQILSIGAVIEDTTTKLPFDKIPKFHAAINRVDLRGSLFAINMNKELISNIVKFQGLKTDEERTLHSFDTGMQFIHEDKIVEEFFYWMFENGLAQDWNFETDGREYLDQQVFIRNGKRFPAFSSKMKPISFSAAGKNFATFDKKFLEKLPRWQQCLKVKQRVIDPAILYVDWNNDDTLPNLSTCKVRAGLPSLVTHNALEDAWDTLLVLRKFY